MADLTRIDGLSTCKTRLAVSLEIAKDVLLILVANEYDADEPGGSE
jgi:hypothetical protein